MIRFGDEGNALVEFESKANPQFTLSMPLVDYLAYAKVCQTAAELATKFCMNCRILNQHKQIVAEKGGVCPTKLQQTA